MKASWEQFPLTALWLPIKRIISLDFASKEPRSRHNRATIAPRSCVDRDLDSPSIAVRFSGKLVTLIPRCHGSRFGAECATIARRLGHDRRAIGPRSWFFVRQDPPSDGDLTVDRDGASDEDRALQKAPRVSTVSQSHDGEMTVR